MASVHTSPAPLSAELVLGKTPSLKEPKLLGGVLYWLEQRPQEQGRTTLMARRGADQAPQELTPGPWNLRCRVHEYGGGACAIGRLVSGEPVAVFVHDGDRCLWRLSLNEGDQQPQRLTSPASDGRFPGALGGGLIDPAGNRWIGVLEAGGRDQLVAVSLLGGEPEPLHSPVDFCGYPALSPNGRQLVWVEWQQPCMPWERSQLWLAEIQADGSLSGGRAVAGSTPADAQGCSVFQPIWAGSDLIVSNDRSGFWNLERCPDAHAVATAATPQWQPLLPMQAEFAMPQWVLGMSTHAWDGEQLVALCCREGSWELGSVVLAEQPGALATWHAITTPFTDLADLCAEAGTLACVASSATEPSGLLELELSSGHWRHQPAARCPVAAEAISRGAPLWFSGHDSQRTQAWYYPPAGGGHPEAPLLVKGHSGPTSMARTGLSLGIQFWTSRGWGVVDVNYGGSTGFGRAYRERLDRQWGVVDVADCAAAANTLVAQGLASAERIAIEGGSAGGFTTLAALCFTTTFRAGASRYGVADLSALAADTHRFEARYLDSLVGPWPVAKATYEARSPLQHAERIRCPVIFFQGLEDLVVPPEQTERMAAALKANGIPVEVHLFPSEGHGFRNGATQIQVLEATEAFFRHHFQL
ncbi:S9 family peptidase [Vulcanococcus sp.]|jgi:dienelactone hydrolase|uniref:S9 family peptidase n=1 Tax=Vulcanococcus sp. TaxID=2856995 RepID=UPI0037DA6D29